MNLPGPASPIEADAEAPVSADAPATANTHWLRLAEYGEWPHRGGLQRFSRDAARSMVEHFRSLRGRLARRFGGLPVYVGHPDDENFAGRPGHTDTRAYAWIRDLQARPDGLYILPRWSEEGRHLLANAFYKFLSPRWALRPEPDGALTPVRLISVGLTNHPNIPGEAIANQQLQQQARAQAFLDSINPQNEPAMFRKLLDALQLDPAPDSENALLESASTLAANAQRSAELDARAAELTEENARLEKLAIAANEALERSRDAFNNERNQRIELLVAEALRRGRIAANEVDAWREGLRTDFDAGLHELREPAADTASALNTESRIQHLVTANVGSPAASRQSFLSLVNARMRDTGEDFATAWCALKQAEPRAYEALVG
ncbi:MAG: phage protease [Opitutales bacterium]